MALIALQPGSLLPSDTSVISGSTASSGRASRKRSGSSAGPPLRSPPVGSCRAHGKSKVLQGQPSRGTQRANLRDRNVRIGMDSEAPARYRRSNTESRSPQSRHPTVSSLLHSLNGVSLHERTSSALVQSRNSHPTPCACARNRDAAPGNAGVSPGRNDNASNRRQPPPIILQPTYREYHHKHEPTSERRERQRRATA